MQEIWAIFQNLLNGLTPKEILFVVGSIAAILVLTEVIKFPIKKFVTNSIKTETTRKRINTIFMILPLIIGAVEGIVCQRLGLTFTQSRGISCGLIAVFLFGIFDRLVKSNAGTTIRDIIEEASSSTVSAKKEFEDTINSILNKK